MKTYTFDEAYEAALTYFKEDELAAKVWVIKYALKDSFGNIYETTPNDMHWRLANEIARIEKKYNKSLSAQELFDLFDLFNYIVPQGSPMTGIGNPFQISSLSNCFVVGLDGKSDSYGGIMRIDEETVQLMKRRGGVGTDLSHIRPKGSPVKNSALTSTGLVPFMERYSNSTREVAQDGRRGALMLSVSSKHPDVLDFIDAKMEQGKVTGANVSVKLDDDLMKSLKTTNEYILTYPINLKTPFLDEHLPFNENIIYSDVEGNVGIVKKIKSDDIWKRVVHNAWKSAEPGVLFWDTIIKESVPDCYSDFGFKTISTNPCGEIPLCPYDSCRLLAINLYSYVINPFTKDAYFDFDLFSQHVKYAQRIMDDIIDLEVEHVNEIIKKIDSDPESDSVKRVEKELWENIRLMAVKGRRTGVGITAEGDMLAALGLIYGTPKATEFATEVHKQIAINAYLSSIELAKERGSFECYDYELEKNNPFIQRLIAACPEIGEGLKKYGRRNIACLTIAPTGTTSLMTRSTSGIEPVFMPVYKRRRKINPNDKDTRVDFVDENGDSWEEYVVFHHKFMIWMEANGYDISKKYTNNEVDEMVAKSPYYKATSNDVDWKEKVRMQGSIQKWVDHSISVTINLPADASEELVSELYYIAWECGCKGCTIYRDGSRAGVLISNDDKPKTELKEKPNRPKELTADVVHFTNNKEKWVAFVGLMNNEPYEIFTGLNDENDGLIIPNSIKNGLIVKNYDEDGVKRYDFVYENKKGYKTTIEGLSYKFNPEYWNYARLISGLLSSAMPLPQVVKLVQDMEMSDEIINTWKNGVGRSLKKYIPDGTKAPNKCPKCGQETLIFEEGCLRCTNCGNSKCGS